MALGGDDMATWQVQQAKSRLSELIEDAKTKGPQIITKHGSETAVVLSIAEYKALQEPQAVPTKPGLAEFLLNSPPIFDTEEEYEEFLADCTSGRGDTGREIDLFLDDDDAGDGATHGADIAA